MKRRDSRDGMTWITFSVLVVRNASEYYFSTENDDEDNVREYFT